MSDDMTLREWYLLVAKYAPMGVQLAEIVFLGRCGARRVVAYDFENERANSDPTLDVIDNEAETNFLRALNLERL